MSLKYEPGSQESEKVAQLKQDTPGADEILPPSPSLLSLQVLEGP